MATSSFDKEFVLNTKKEVDSFTKIISTTVISKKIDRSLTSYENRQRGDELIIELLNSSEFVKKR